MPQPLLLTLILTLTALWIGGCATNPVTGGSDFVLMSEDQEIALGRQMHPKMLAETPLYDDPALAAYVQRVGESVAAKSHRPNLIYRFHLLDSAQVNAFALPGGYIYITRGLLAYLNSEAELAAVLGHEVGHVTVRHSVRQHSAATATNILGAVVASAAGVRGAGDLANIAGTALIRGYGRDHELEADRLGAEYLARSGYEPDAMFDVIRVLKNQELFERRLAEREDREPRVYHGVFSTHPDNDRRLQEVINAAKSIPKPPGAGQGRGVFLDQLDGLTFGDSEEQGIRRGNAFYHGPLDFRLQFPQDWRIENLPDRILAHAPGNDGLMQFSMQDLNKRIEPREFMLTRLKLDNLEHEQAIDHGGMRGHTAVSAENTPFGRRPVRYVVLYRDDKALLFVGASKPKDQPFLHDEAILATARSFAPLSEAERKLAASMRIRLITAKANTDFRKLAQESSIPNYPEEQLRLLNDLFPDGTAQAGRRLKVVH